MSGAGGMRSSRGVMSFGMGTRMEAGLEVRVWVVGLRFENAGIHMNGTFEFGDMYIETNRYTNG